MVFTEVGAVGQFAYGEAHAAIGVVEYSVEISQVVDVSEFGDEGLHPFAANARGSDHGEQVTVKQLRRAAIDEQELPEVVANDTAFDQLEHRQPDAFLPDLGGFGVIGAGQASADVVLMSSIAAEPDQTVVHKDRSSDNPIRQMIATGHIGV